MRRSTLAVLFACFAVPAAAQHALEIMPLRHRTVEQVLPSLRLLLEPGGTLSGERGQLFVRASPGNVAELKQALALIDRPLRRLQISVRFEESGQARDRDIAAGASVTDRGARVGVRGRDEQSMTAERVDQRIQVLEGGRALIMTGHSTPLPGAIRDTASGFEAVPRLSGERVLVDVAPQKESLDRQQRVATTLSARLGEWFEVAGSMSSSGRSADARRVWLKVEALP
jgi:hypothetical protein